MRFLSTIHLATFPAAELLTGMGLAQIIATLQVYVSNRRLFDQMAAVAAAGFLPVPSPNVVPHLLNPATAMAAGLLFTLSVGAGLALLAAAAGWWWSWSSPRGRGAAALAIGVQTTLLLIMNSRGFDVWVSLYAVIIPAPVFWMTRRIFSTGGQAPHIGFWVGRGLPLVLLALGWATQYDRGLFIDVRDHLLMPNSVGRAISSFYYRYTLCSAEVFKPLDQRLIRTVAWPEDEPPPADIRRELIRNDYLPVALDRAADLSLRIQGDRMAFIRNGQILLAVTTARFRADPYGTMATISAAADTWSFFRSFTFYSVLLAFPMALYFLMFAGLRLAFGTMGHCAWADVLSALSCLLIGLGILGFFHAGRQTPSLPDDVSTALASSSGPTRVAALREIRRRGLDVSEYPGYSGMLVSPLLQERYWLARALSTGSSSAASADLIFLLDDPGISVKTQALEAIAQRGDYSALPAIMSRLKMSQDWYFQLYAYRALRALGWNQTVLR